MNPETKELWCNNCREVDRDRLGDTGLDCQTKCQRNIGGADHFKGLKMRPHRLVLAGNLRSPGD
ncbi:hypothetical protein, partial [Mycobacterium paragordonae]|uniref:hypothetical protein n=1 Tax=Mycobacterium paragordonae TaxID=1389713 RepID=UPI001E62B915